MFMRNFKFKFKVIKMNLSDHDLLLIDILEVMVRKRKLQYRIKNTSMRSGGNQNKEIIRNSVSSWTTYKIKYSKLKNGEKTYFMQ